MKKTTSGPPAPSTTPPRTPPRPLSAFGFLTKSREYGLLRLLRDADEAVEEMKAREALARQRAAEAEAAAAEADRRWTPDNLD